MENKIKELQEKNARLEEENRSLKEQISKHSIPEEFVEHRGAFFKRLSSGGYHNAVYCPRCKTSIAAMEDFLPFVCDCGWMANFHGKDLEKILDELELVSGDGIEPSI